MGKAPALPCSQRFPDLSHFSISLLQELCPAASTLIPSFFHSWDHWEVRASNTAHGMVQQPWHGHFSSTFLCCPQILGDSGSTTFQEIQGKPLQMGWDRWTDVQGCYLCGAREWQLRAEINPPARGKCPFQWLPALPGAAGPSWESCLGSSTLDKITHS